MNSTYDLVKINKLNARTIMSLTHHFQSFLELAKMLRKAILTGEMTFYSF